MTPQEEAAEAEQARDQLEEAMLVLFVTALIAQTNEQEEEDREIDVTILRRLVTGLVGHFRRVLARGGVENLELEPTDPVVDKVLPEITKNMRDLRKWVAKQPQAEAGELSVQRRAARALSTGSFNSVASAVAEEHKVTVRKIWVTRADPKVRPLHRRLHGRARPLNSSFYRWPTGQQLRYPGDPQAPLDAVIGCRCVLVMTTSTPEEIKRAFPPLPPEEK